MNNFEDIINRAFDTKDDLDKKLETFFCPLDRALIKYEFSKKIKEIREDLKAIIDTKEDETFYNTFDTNFNNND